MGVSSLSCWNPDYVHSSLCSSEVFEKQMPRQDHMCKEYNENLTLSEREWEGRLDGSILDCHAL